MTISLSSPQTSLVAFVAISLVQAVVFMVAPEIFASFASGLDDVPFIYFRLIGAKEIGLMLMYCVFIRSGSRALMMLTVLGRFSTVPMLVWFVVGKGGPYTLLFGCVLDITFASWTLLALLRQGGDAILDFPMPSSMRELAARFCMCVCGMLELFSGSLILADQTMQSQIGASWAPVAQLKPKEDDLQLGLCSFAYMTCIIACYQIFIGVRAAPASVLVAVAIHHPLTLQQALFPFLVMWLARDPKLSTLSPPPFHWPCAAAAATAAMLLPRHAETAKGEKQD